MKTRPTLRLLFFLLLGIAMTSYHTVQAQHDIIVNEILEYISSGEKPGLEVAIVDADPKMVEKDWKKFLKRYKTKAKRPKKSKEIFADNATIPDMSGNTVDVYALTESTEYGTKLSVFFDLGGSFVSSQYHNKAFGAGMQLLRNFALMEAGKVVDSELKNQQAVLKTLKKELKEMLASKTKSIREVEKAKALIEQREKDIQKNDSASNIKQQQIEIQKEIIATLKSKLGTLK